MENMENYGKYEKMGVETKQAKLLLELEVITGHYPIIPRLEIKDGKVIGFNFYTRQLIDENVNIDEMMNIIKEFTSLKKLTMTGIEQCGLTYIPQEIFSLKSLEWLDLSHNSLEAVPKSIGNLTALKHLNLYSNLLSTLPEELGNIHSLIELNIGLNRIETVPQSIEKNQKLKILQGLKIEKNTSIENITKSKNNEFKTIEIVDNEEFEKF